MMTVARSQLVNPDVTRFYHVISRCVRRAFLCGEGKEHRKDWLEARLKELAGTFAIDVCGYAILDNHLHLLVRLNGGLEEGEWTGEEVARRWARAFPERGLHGEVRPPRLEKLAAWARDEAWVEKSRERLASLGWFMRCLKEPLARMANREDGCTGAFWEARYRSIGILDEESLVATLAYIDLNPVAAGLARFPEEAKHTSIRTRIEDAQGTRPGDEEPRVKSRPEEPGGEEPGGEESDGESSEGSWLCSLGKEPGKAGTGMLEGLDLRSYLGVVDWMARVKRPGKTAIDEEAPTILERLGIGAERFRERVSLLAGLAGARRLVGSVAGSRASAKVAAEVRGVGWVRNLWGILG